MEVKSEVYVRTAWTEGWSCRGITDGKKGTHGRESEGGQKVTKRD